MDLELLEKICMGFKGVTQDIKWENDLCFLIGEKMFAATGLTGPLKVSFKVLTEEFGALTARNGIIPAPYLARYHWVLITDPDGLSQEEWEYYLRQSYNLVLQKLPKKIQKQILETN